MTTVVVTREEFLHYVPALVSPCHGAAEGSCYIYISPETTAA